MNMVNRYLSLHMSVFYFGVHLYNGIYDVRLILGLAATLFSLYLIIKNGKSDPSILTLFKR